MPAKRRQFVSALPQLPDLEAELIGLLRQIPYGRVATFGQMAQALGSHQAAKWVAAWLIDEVENETLPTHRVVRVDGSIGSYRSRTADQQIAALQAEQIDLSSGRVELERFQFRDLESTAPLQKLAAWQSELAEQISLKTPVKVQRPIRSVFSPSEGPSSSATDYCVAGVDVSYVTPTYAVAAYVLINLHSGELVWSATREQQIDFPYISGFLALRELPALLPLLDDVAAAGKLVDVILVDGHGVLHPRRMGIASHLGVVTGLSTIGVGKTLSVGSVDLREMMPHEMRPILDESKTTIGTAMQPLTGGKPVYFSPGHRIDLATANLIVSRLFDPHRLPTPTYWADKLSREAARKLVQNREPPGNEQTEATME